MKESLLNTKLPSPRDASLVTTIRRHSFPMELVHLNKNEVSDLDKAQGGAKFKGKYRDYTDLGHKFMDGKFVNNLNKEIRHFHASGGMAKLAKIKKSGRYGDTELAYMPKHVADRMDRMIGGTCVNPQTKKREYFLGDLVKSIGSAMGSGTPASTGAAGASAGTASGGSPSWMAALAPLAQAGMQAFNAYQQPGGDWKKALAAGVSSGAGSVLDQYGGQNGQMINNMIQSANKAYQNNQGVMGAAKQGALTGVNGVADRMSGMGGAAGMAGSMLRTGANAYQNGQGLMGAAQQAGMQGVNSAIDHVSNMGGAAGMVGNAARGAMSGYMQPNGNMQQAMYGAMSGAMQPQQSKPADQQVPMQRPQQSAQQPAKQEQPKVQNQQGAQPQQLGYMPQYMPPYMPQYMPQYGQQYPQPYAPQYAPQYGPQFNQGYGYA